MTVRERLEVTERQITVLTDWLSSIVERIAEAEQRLTALETSQRAPRPTAARCDGAHLGHPCADTECWVLRRYREQQVERA